MKIAICDDVEDFLIWLEHMLRELNPFRSEGLEIEGFSSGEALLEVFQAGKYAAVILDIEMKELDGFETARRIRGLDQAVVIAFHTSHASVQICDEALFGCEVMVKGQRAQRYKEQFASIFHACMETAQTQQISVRKKLRSRRLPRPEQDESHENDINKQ